MAIKALRSASALALLIGTSGVSGAFAQQTTAPAPTPAPNQTVTTAAPALQGPQAAPQVDQTAAPEQQTPTDRVVITGSLIATTPEDAPKPVEVYTAEDLEQQGSPSVTEFIRSLTVSYGDDLGFGQASADVPEGSGFGNANLRGLGSNATLALMNGRPLAPWNGSFGADVNTVPMEALESVEILKGGASATYGAGAVAGVINFRTRRDIDAPQITLQKQFYEGSDGQYKVDFLTGWVGDSGNVLVSLSHSHEDEMLASERDFSNQPFNINPAQYAGLVQSLLGSNPGEFQVTTSNFHTNTGPILVAAGSPGFPGVYDYRTPDDCRAIGGEITNILQPNAQNLVPGAANLNCAWNPASFLSLVNENTTDRAFLEFNTNITDTMEAHFDVNWSSNRTVEARTPIDFASVQAIDRTNDSTALGARRGFFGSACGACNYVIPVQIQTFTPRVGTSTSQPAGTPTGTFFRNPFIDDFLARTRQNTANNPGGVPFALPDTGALYMGTNWRPFLFGGNPFEDDGRRRNTFERDSFTVNASLKGEFTEDTWIGPWLSGIKYNFGGQYNQYLNTYHQPDIFASRLQNAMLGYGGPNCNAIDRVPTDYTSAASYNRTVGTQSNTAPGTDGCQWFNPFASAFQTSVVNGAANPQFNSGAPTLPGGATATARPTGYANPADLMDWMWGNKVAEFKLESVTFDANLSGTVPESLFTLPGGEIGWAVGSQWRQVEGRRFNNEDNGDEEQMNVQDCVWPDRAVVEIPTLQEPTLGAPGCTTAGAFFGTGRLTIVGNTSPPWYYDNQNVALFAEVQLPVLDNLNFQYSVRHEEWNGGDLKGDIYAIAGKWDVTDNLYVRSDYSTNYRADAALELRPGEVEFTTSGQGRFGTGFQTQQSTTIASDLQPEEDKTFNFGVGYQSDLGEGRIRAGVNFFEILIDGEVTTTSATTILNNIFGTNTATCQFDRSSAAGCGGPDNVATGIPTLANGNDNPNQLANCSATLISFVAFTNNAACVQGTTRGGDLAEIKRFQLNGPGFIVNGIDYTVDYAVPLFDGTFSAQMTATQNLVYKAHGFDVNGVIFDTGGHRLGYVNVLGRTGNESRRWEANGTLRWANDTHNVSLRANYTSGTKNEQFDLGGLTAIVANNPATTANETVNSTYGIFPKTYLDFDLQYVYTAPFWKDLELRATVLNIFDKNPTAAQTRLGYYGATGNPRGRIIEIGVTKKF